MGMVHVAAKFIPWLLTVEQPLICLNMHKQTKRQKFLKITVVSDET